MIMIEHLQERLEQQHIITPYKQLLQNVFLGGSEPMKRKDIESIVICAVVIFVLFIVINGAINAINENIEAENNQNVQDLIREYKDVSANMKIIIDGQAVEYETLKKEYSDFYLKYYETVIDFQEYELYTLQEGLRFWFKDFSDMYYDVVEKVYMNNTEILNAVGEFDDEYSEINEEFYVIVEQKEEFYALLEQYEASVQD